MKLFKAVVLVVLAIIIVSLVTVLFLVPIDQTSQVEMRLSPLQRHFFIFNDTSGTTTTISVLESGGYVRLTLISPTGEKALNGVEVHSSYTYTFTATRTGTYTMCVLNSPFLDTNITLSIVEERTLIDFL